MQSKNTRIAHLKRMLKRLEDEEARLRGLAAAGELTPEGASLGVDQLDRQRAQFASELRTVERGRVTQ